MKITDHLRTQNIFLDVDLPDKSSILHFIADTCVENGIVTDAWALFNGLVKREETMSTGVGGGLAFPHTLSPEAQNAEVILIRLSKPVDFDALDNKPVEIVLALIIPEKTPETHVRLLARISRLCRDLSFVEAVKQTPDPNRLWREMQNVEERTAFH